MKCEVCEINEADLEDWRDFGYNQGTEKFQACKNCINLKDVPFMNLLDADTIDEKKNVIGDIVDSGDLEDWIVKK
tara:strand:+ start:212 stop:436 length:225 start_codon:yes stop_codon:yes gene_type:complete